MNNCKFQKHILKTGQFLKLQFYLFILFIIPVSFLNGQQTDTLHFDKNIKWMSIPRNPHYYQNGTANILDVFNRNKFVNSYYSLHAEYQIVGNNSRYICIANNDLSVNWVFSILTEESKIVSASDGYKI